MIKLPYLRTMFATCMLFQAVYVLCVVLWLAFPDLKGHALLQAVFLPYFALLSVGSFIYGLREHDLRLDRCDHFCVLLQFLATTDRSRFRAASCPN